MTATDDPMPGVLLIPHAAIPVSGSFEVKYPDTRKSEYFYFEENRERRWHLQVMTRAEALKVTQAKA